MKTKIKILDITEMEVYFVRHFPHRLVLLRTLTNRKERNWNNSREGDLYRCVKDSCLITIRLWMEFFGFCVEDQKLVQGEGKNHKEDDIYIYSFTKNWIPIKDLPISDEECELLRRVFIRANKEIAHITDKDDGDYNTEEKLIEAAKIVEQLIKTHLYDPLGKELPTHSKCY